MEIGMIGLGRMGANMLRRLADGGHECIGYDLEDANVATLVKEGYRATTSLDAFVAALSPPRAAWCMVPDGGPTESVVRALCERFAPGDIIIDGGNSYFKDDVRRADTAAKSGIHYVDVGTSGGVWGLERGYCLMIGGEVPVVERLQPLFETLAPGIGAIERTAGRAAQDVSPAERGYLHCGPVGAGHFVKMVHNGIEYGLMQAYAEGFDIFRNAASDALPENIRYEFDLPEIAELWRRGSVVSSWLLDLTAIALLEDPDLEAFSGQVSDSGEGRWTVQAAIDEAVPAHVLTAALFARFRSRQESSYADKLLSAMRKQFGGHQEPGGAR